MGILNEFVRSSERASRKYSKQGDSLPKAVAKGAGETLLITILSIIGFVVFVFFIFALMV